MTYHGEGLKKLTFSKCRCEPFPFCHSEQSEESIMPSLRVNFMNQSQEIATSACRNARLPQAGTSASSHVASLLAMTVFLRRGL